MKDSILAELIFHVVSLEDKSAFMLPILMSFGELVALDGRNAENARDVDDHAPSGGIGFHPLPLHDSVK